jgi:FkbM family methyltransferase
MRLPLLPPGKTILRSIGLAALADYSPYRLGHPFYQTVPRMVYRLHKGWITNQDYIKEADAAIAAYDGGDFIDVGAAKGVYSLFLAPKAKDAKFLVLEPDPEFIKPLLATVEAAMANNPSFVPYVAPIGAGSERTARLEFNTNERRFWADVARIDDLVETFGLKPSFVKIDVDGPEYRVLRGMRDTIEKYRPTVLLELHYSCWRDGETEADILGQLPGYRFEPIWESFFNNDPRERCSRVLCVPPRN